MTLLYRNTTTNYLSLILVGVTSYQININKIKGEKQRVNNNNNNNWYYIMNCYYSNQSYY